MNISRITGYAMNRSYNNKGFTLVEMLVVMVVFVVIIAITGESFKTILSQSAKLFRSEESNVEGIVGLEMLRHDIQQAGFGLFTETSPIAYTGEATVSPASNYNDSTTGPPRPIVTAQITAATGVADDAGDSYSIVNGTDYLVVKATSVGRSAVAQKWSYLNYSANVVSPNKWRSSSENFASGDRVVVLKRTVTTSTSKSELVKDSSAGASFFFAYSDVGFEQFSSTSATLMTVYGVDRTPTSSPVNLRMPFNRADFFVAVPPSSSATKKKPSFCSTDSNVGTLYKMTVNHADGKLNPVPLLDCVADMQIVLGWDLRTSTGAGQDGIVDTWSNADGSTVSGSASVGDVQTALTSVSTIRSALKLVKVYVLAQDGRKNLGYTAPATILVGDADTKTGESSLLTRTYALSSEMRNYKWKVYRIVTRPKNLLSNQ